MRKKGRAVGHCEVLDGMGGLDGLRLDGYIRWW